MRRCWQSSLHRRLMAAAMLACTLVVTVAMLTFVMLGYYRYGRTVQHDVEAVAEIIAESIGSLVAFEDDTAVQQKLEQLADNPYIRAAQVLRLDDEVTATYFVAGAEDEPFPPLERDQVRRVDGSRISLILPIQLAGDPLGMFQVVGQWETLRQYLMGYAGMIGLVLGVSVGIAYLLMTPISRMILNPILDLTESIKLVTHRKDYSLRVDKRGGGEVGILIDGFNGMLDQICQHDDTLYRSQGELERLVKQRTAEHARINEDLKQVVEEVKVAKDQAEAANRTKSQFLARMSHEIRTPMNGVLGMTDLLLNSGLTERQTELAEMVYRSGEALLHIINDILDFSKIEAGKLDLDSMEFRIRDLLDETMELMGEHAQKKGLELVGMVDDAVPTRMAGDPHRLRQILINLIGNAIKFTSAGEVVVRVESVHEANGNAILKFLVSDSGIGIPSEACARVFDPFSQADGSTTRKFGGTGLGLAICRQLAVLMGGEIGVESEPGEGATFWFTACFKDPQHMRDEHSGSRPRLGATRLVVLSPSDPLRESLERRLSNWGVKVKATDNASDALELLRRDDLTRAPVTGALVDTSMREINAPSFAQLVATDPAISEVPLVLMTEMRPGADGTARTAGYCATLRKPVREAELYQAVAALSGIQVDDVTEKRVSRLPSRFGDGTQFRAHILVAEDNPVNQEVVNGMLSSLGCQVTLAGNGREAVDCVRDGAYDLVLMDCHMPEMDGFDATRTIRQVLREQEELEKAQGEGLLVRRLPVVALTANAMDGDRELCLARGMDDYMSKPFSLSDLEKTLMKWIPDCREACTGSGHKANVSRVAGDNTSLPGPASVPAPAVPPAPPVAPAPPVPPEPTVVSTPVRVPEPSDAAEEDPLDRRVLESIRAVERSGVPDLLGRVVVSYLEETPKLLQQLREAVCSRDPNRIKIATHTLKSSSANVGARELALHCKGVDGLAPDALAALGEPFADQADRYFETVQQALQAEVPGVAG